MWLNRRCRSHGGTIACTISIAITTENKFNEYWMSQSYRKLRIWIWESKWNCLSLYCVINLYIGLFQWWKLKNKASIDFDLLLSQNFVFFLLVVNKQNCLMFGHCSLIFMRRKLCKLLRRHRWIFHSVGVCWMKARLLSLVSVICQFWHILFFSSFFSNFSVTNSFN